MSDSIRFLPIDQALIDTTLAEWQSRSPQMGVLALLPEAEQARLPLLQAACRERGVALAGGIFPALVSASGFGSEGAWLFRLDPMVPAFLIAQLNAGQPGAAEKIARAVEPALAAYAAHAAESVKPTLYLIFDSLVPNIATILDGLYLRLADRVRYAGVNAGSETFQPLPCVFDGERVVGDGVLALLLPGRATTVLAHGYAPPERGMTATSTAGNRVISIDWRPAFDVYQEVIKAEYGIDLTPANFYQYAVHFPFGILRASDEVVVRIPVALTDDGSLHCVGEVPENTMLVLLRAPPAGTGSCVGDLVTTLEATNGSLRGRGLLTFYCAGRRMHLGGDAAAELSELQRRTGAATIAGALSLGEIGSTREWGYPMFHNATLVCTPWPDG
jgi:hypothetical protein